MEAEGERSLKPQKCANLLANEPKYQLYSNLYFGRVCQPPAGTRHPHTGEEITTYLVPHEAEDRALFSERQANAFVLPYPRDVIRVITATLFRQEPSREALFPAFREEYLADVDLRGHSAGYFAKQIFLLAEIFGWAGSLTSTPPATRQVQTRLDEERAGVRPYSWIVQPLDLWSWRRDPVTEFFLEACVRSGPAEWTWWWPDRTVVVDAEGHRKPGGGHHTLGEVPLDILTCDAVESREPLDPFGLSALADIDRIALHLYQLCSQLEAHEREVLFAFLHLRKDAPKNAKAQAPDVHLGNRHYLWLDGDVRWVDAPSGIPVETRNQISWCLQEMRRAAGVATRTEESQEAHSGVAIIWEAADKHALIHERGLNLEDWECSLWRRHARYSGRAIPPRPVRYPQEYIVQSVDHELAQLERMVQVVGGWAAVPEGLRPYFMRKWRRIVLRDMGHLPKAEVDDLLEAVRRMEDPADGIRAATGGARLPARGDARPGGGSDPGLVPTLRGSDGNVDPDRLSAEANPGQSGGGNP